jgi:hypothetical protein
MYFTLSFSAAIKGAILIPTLFSGIAPQHKDALEDEQLKNHTYSSSIVGNLLNLIRTHNKPFNNLPYIKNIVETRKGILNTYFYGDATDQRQNKLSSFLFVAVTHLDPETTAYISSHPSLNKEEVARTYKSVKKIIPLNREKVKDALNSNNPDRAQTYKEVVESLQTIEIILKNTIHEERRKKNTREVTNGWLKSHRFPF